MSVKRDLHRSAKDFAISFVKSTSFESRKLLRRGNSLRRAHSDRTRADIVDCPWTLVKKISRNGFDFLQSLSQPVRNAAVGIVLW